MKFHSLIQDSFFTEPHRVRGELLQSPMIDYQANDNVVYPGIVDPPLLVKNEIKHKIKSIMNSEATFHQIFARHSMETMNPPNWAHSDYNMCDYVALIYLSPFDYPDDGTYLVAHNLFGFDTHPKDQKELEILLADSNRKELWTKRFFCPSKFNRCFIVNAHYLHAAGDSFGRDRDSSRLVMTAFFNLS